MPNQTLDSDPMSHSFKFECLPTDSYDEIEKLLSDPNRVSALFLKEFDGTYHAMEIILDMLGTTINEERMTRKLLLHFAEYMTDLEQLEVLFLDIWRVLSEIPLKTQLSKSSEFQIIDVAMIAKEEKANNWYFPILVEAGDAPLTRSQIERTLLHYGTTNCFREAHGQCAPNGFSDDHGYSLLSDYNLFYKTENRRIAKSSKFIDLALTENIFYANGEAA